MYSVLIQNKKTIESFQKYHSLFMEVLNEGSVGVCRWIESGTTVKTALPELLELIEDKEEWRAIIVRFEDEDVMREYESFSMNPYDFRYYHENTVPYGESNIPLVRLTHMLGQIPAPKIHYEVEKITEKGKTAKVIYKPEKNVEEEQEYINLLKKYDYDGPRPSEIILVTLRNKGLTIERDSIEKAWITRNEIESSSFWEVNRYSNLCRFIVYDVTNRGNFQREADYFGFWSSVLLLAMNRIEAVELQAYRLYKMKIHYDKKVLRKSVQTFVDELLGARIYMNLLLEEEERKLLSEQHLIPEYALRVPVVMETPGLTEMEVPVKEFPVTSPGSASDIRMWNHLAQEKEEMVSTSVQKTMISLEDSADRMRDLCSFDDRKIKELNRFQKKKMIAELRNLFSMVLSIQKDLPDEKQKMNKGIKEAEDDVKNTLRKRVTTGQVLGTIGWILLAAVLCILPGLVISAKSDMWFPEGNVSALLILVDVIVIPLLVIVLLHRYKLKKDIQHYNEELTRYVATVADNTGLYEDFLSAIASHSRGSSYLNLLRSKIFVVSNMRKEVKGHLDEVDKMLQILERWSRAFHLEGNFRRQYYHEVEPDIYVKPKKNQLYTFEYGNLYTIPLNESGSTVKSPYVFITKMELRREELYEYHDK